MNDHSRHNGSAAVPASAPNQLFRLGQVVATPDALTALLRSSVSPMELLKRHATGDWGDLCEEDIQQNRIAIQHGLRIFSSYQLEGSDGQKIWVITEADRSVTTFLLPEEY